MSAYDQGFFIYLIYEILLFSVQFILMESLHTFEPQYLNCISTSWVKAC